MMKKKLKLKTSIKSTKKPKPFKKKSQGTSNVKAKAKVKGKKKKGRLLRTIRKAQKSRKISKLRKDLRNEFRRRRRMEKSLALLLTIKTTMKKFFSLLEDKLKSVKDPRKGSKIYSIHEVLFMAILHFIFRGDSLNRHDGRRLMDSNFKKNTLEIFGIKLPSANTIRRIVKDVDPKELEELLRYMVLELKDRRFFSKYPVLGRAILISIDATIYNKSELYQELSVKKVYNKSEKVVYYRAAIEAKICLANGVNIPILSEWIETPDGSKKEDCEINAFKRLAVELKKLFPRQEIIIVADGLYANEPVISICRKNKWKFIIGQKNGQNKNSWHEVHDQLGLNRDIPNNEMAETIVNNGDKNFEENAKIYIKKEEVPYKDKTENITEVWALNPNIKHKEQDISMGCVTIFNGTTTDYREKVFFSFIYSRELNKHSVVDIVSAGRLGRSMIEDSFNTEKNRGYKASHKFARISGQATKNFKVLMHMGEIINNLVSQSDDVQVGIITNNKITLIGLWENMLSFLAKSKLCASLVRPENLTGHFTYKVMSQIYIS